MNKPKDMVRCGQREDRQVWHFASWGHSVEQGGQVAMSTTAATVNSKYFDNNGEFSTQSELAKAVMVSSRCGLVAGLTKMVTPLTRLETLEVRKRNWL